MPDISQMSESKFLKRGDIAPAKLLTIAVCEKMNVAKDDSPKEMKWCLVWEEEEKPMVLNKTNGELIAQFSGERNSDNWGGVRVVVYDDPTISFKGELVGVIRVRAPKGKAAQQAPIAKPAPAQLDDDEVVEAATTN